MTNEDKLIGALLLILDSVDYTKGACGLNEQVGAVLPPFIINNARNIIEHVQNERQPS